MSNKNVLIDGAEFQEIDTSPQGNWTPEFTREASEEENIELFFSLSPHTLSELQDYSIQSGISPQSAVEQAVRNWIDTRTKTRSASDQ
jgi:hypothetical protein